MDSARLRLDVINSIGADASAMIRNLNATNNQTSSAIALSAPGILNTRLNINRASESGNASDPVRPTTLSLSLDRSNSNLVDLLENIPDRLDYNLDLSLNPWAMFREAMISFTVTVSLPHACDLNYHSGLPPIRYSWLTRWT